MCPSRGEIRRRDVANVGQQLFAQRRRLLRIERDGNLSFLAATAMSIPRSTRWHPRSVILWLERAVYRWRQQRDWSITQIRRIKIILAGDANEREQGIAASVGQRSAHALGMGGLRDRTDRPVRR
jgi:hypothetical protein